MSDFAICKFETPARAFLIDTLPAVEDPEKRLPPGLKVNGATIIFAVYTDDEERKEFNYMLSSFAVELKASSCPVDQVALMTLDLQPYQLRGKNAPS